MQFIFRTKEQRIKSGHEIIGLLSQERFNAFVHSILIILATALLLVPVFILYEIRDRGGY